MTETPEPSPGAAHLVRSAVLATCCLSIAFVVLVVIAVLHRDGGSNPAAALAVLTVPFIVICAVGLMYARRLDRVEAPDKDRPAAQTPLRLFPVRGWGLLLGPGAALAIAALALVAGDQALAIVCGVIAVVGLLVAAFGRRRSQ